MPSNLLDTLRSKYAPLTFKGAQDFYWSPKNQTVYFNADDLDEDHGRWALIHEVSHGLIGHKTYGSDFELLVFEVQAWEKAKEVAGQLGMNLSETHIERCLDTYRDWLYARSTCITCQVNSFQISPHTYMCINCTDTWRVSSSRFCRPYRKKHHPERAVLNQ